MGSGVKLYCFVSLYIVLCLTILFLAIGIKSATLNLFNSHGFCEVSRFIHIGPFAASGVVGQ